MFISVTRSSKRIFYLKHRRNYSVFADSLLKSWLFWFWILKLLNYFWEGKLEKKSLREWKEKKKQKQRKKERKKNNLIFIRGIKPTKHTHIHTHAKNPNKKIKQQNNKNKSDNRTDRSALHLMLNPTSLMPGLSRHESTRDLSVHRYSHPDRFLVQRGMYSQPLVSPKWETSLQGHYGSQMMANDNNQPSIQWPTHPQKNKKIKE